MTDNFMRHLIAFLALLLSILIFASGYIGGEHGWWWISFGLIFIYIITYKLIDAGGGH